jgi:hypothetical protein
VVANAFFSNYNSSKINKTATCSVESLYLTHVEKNPKTLGRLRLNMHCIS